MLSRLAQQHVDAVVAFHERHGPELNWFSAGYRKILGRIYRVWVPPQASVLEIGCGSGALLAELPNRDLVGVDPSPAMLAAAQARLPHARFQRSTGEELALDRTFDVVIVSDTVHEAADIQQLFQALQRVCTPGSRLVLNFFSSLWRPLLAAASKLGLRREQPPLSWLSPNDIRNLLELADWELIRMEPKILLPLRLGGLERWINRSLAPLLPWFCLTRFAVARPRLRPQPGPRPSVSVVVPARNEAGNLESLLDRLPDFQTETELILVEGGSSDDTWKVIEQLAARPGPVAVRAIRQSGRGKGNAVREGFAAARGELLMTLDADLSVPPEELVKFYDALACGHAELANGVRLVYPMEPDAMRFLNMGANKFFSMAFTWLLGQPIKDTLCGTKALSRCDYRSIAANRAAFGDFDPFGDFDLLFGAARMNLKIADLPIRYRERRYGRSNIRRWRHGILLLRMLMFAARKIKFV